MVFYPVHNIFEDFKMSWKVYNFRYARGTKPGSVREVLVHSDNDTPQRITGYDRFADLHEGGLRKFDTDQMTHLTVYDAKVIECRDEKSAAELEKLGGYHRFGSNVVISKTELPPKLSGLQSITENNGYINIQYNNKSFQLKSDVSKRKNYGYMHWYANCGNNDEGVSFEDVIEALYKETKRTV